VDVGQTKMRTDERGKLRVKTREATGSKRGTACTGSVVERKRDSAPTKNNETLSMQRGLRGARR